ncbi:MAG: NAD(P)/FAD-dependent oxidoreductase [Anaerolineae bacterium]|nr:NAD(P)/FAD-dependent oxidoreductase [Anaerolineae bacterium]
MTEADILIIGAGAAGLMTAIIAGRTHPNRRILVLDGAAKLGAKILVAGGGRCNVTHDEVSAEAYAGSSRNAIKKVLRRFDVPETVAFFRELGVDLKREDTGKLFPVTDDAHTVLEALLQAAREVGAVIQHPARVTQVERAADGFRVSGEWGSARAPKLVLATGGRALPKSGSDGGGYELARSLGHRLTDRIFPALVPLTLPRDHFICALSGITLQAGFKVRSGAGKCLASFTNSTLCTHFGLSGPSVLDISRYYLDAKLDDPTGTRLLMNWLPEQTSDSFEAGLLAAGRVSAGRFLGRWLPERLARALCEAAGIEPTTACDQLSRPARKALVETVTALPLPITGDRGYTYAEVTAGGIPLTDIRLETMESRLCPGLYVCGEICDVDGRIGGYNFQWAWSSGYVVGVSV